MDSRLPGKIDLIDVTLRDGFQHEERYIPLETRLELARRLLDAGFRRLEVGSVSHPDYVPQFREIDELLLRLPQREGVEYTVLALTPRAIERVGGLLDRGAAIHRVLTGQIATSEAYAMKNMRRTHQQLFEEAAKNVAALHAMGVKRVVGNIGTVFGCPIQGEVPLDRAYEFVDRMFDIGFDEVEHSDPDGVAAPERVREYFSVVMERHPDPAAHSFHAHDIRGLGLDGYRAAMAAGVRVFDCALGGIGGQVANVLDGVPVKGAGEYYFPSGRTGLVSTEDLVVLAAETGVATGIDREKICAAGRELERVLGRKLDSFTLAGREV